MRHSRLCKRQINETHKCTCGWQSSIDRGFLANHAELTKMQNENARLREALERIADSKTLYNCISPEAMIAREALEK